ncbi:MAG: phage holin family protein [Chitinivibrionales bacterium]|nr:phage holin family protein [Chitinivibrionales bacterium]
MGTFLARLLISALSLGVAAYLVPGIRVDGVLTLILAAFLMGIVNAIVRPILIILTLPITILTLGLFLLVINAMTFALVAWLMPGFSVAGLGSAFMGWLLVSLVGWLGSKVFFETAKA